jgi:putative endonuclease
MGAFVYMLRCSDRSFYIGSATGDDLTKRMAEHQSGSFAGYTATRRPVHLVWSQHFDRITDAIAAERQIKGWSQEGGADQSRLGIASIEIETSRGKAKA